MIHQYYTKRFHENRHWVAAIVAFDYADPQPLSKLIESDPIPIELRPVIAKIIRGERKGKKRKGSVNKHAILTP